MCGQVVHRGFCQGVQLVLREVGELRADLPNRSFRFLLRRNVTITR